MAAMDRIGRAGEAVRAAQANRYLQRFIEDEELRNSLRAAYGAARGAYGRMSNGRPATHALFEDRKLQRELKTAATALREVSDALRAPPKRTRRRGGVGRALLLLAIAGILALVLSESLRSKVLDLLFGAEEEFDYSSTTAPPEPAPAGVSSS
jgi:ferric-dicitrate binding protein FerR (iron transport regulator)